MYILTRDKDPNMILCFNNNNLDPDSSPPCTYIQIWYTLSANVHYFLHST